MLLLLALVLLVLKSRIALPLVYRGIAGQGLYSPIATVPFVETALFTFSVLAWAGRGWLRMTWPRAVAAGAAAALLNFGLMVLDARWQTFPAAIETTINARFGSFAFVSTLGIAAALAGLAALAVVARTAGLGEKR